MEISGDELIRLARKRKATDQDVAEFLGYVKEAENLFSSTAELSDSAELFRPIADRINMKTTVGDLHNLIFAVCNILEESPLQLYIATLQLNRKEPISEAERETLESMNWNLDLVKQKERRSIIEKLIRLQDKIEK